MKNQDYNVVLLEIVALIKKARKSKNITVQELAYRCEMERSNMSRIESGRVNITIKTLTILANALNLNIRDLIPKHTNTSNEETK